jgi:hypothetical protein
VANTVANAVANPDAPEPSQPAADPVPTALTPLVVQLPGDARRWTAVAAGTSVEGPLLLLSCAGEAPRWRRTVDVVSAATAPPDGAPTTGAIRISG